MDNFHLQGVRKNIGKLNMSSQSCVENGEGGPIFLCVGGAKKILNGDGVRFWGDREFFSGWGEQNKFFMNGEFKVLGWWPPKASR